jgi:hypothetical protein
VQVSAPKPVCVEGFPGIPASTKLAAQSSGVEDIENLTLKPQLHMLGQGKPFCQVEVAPEEQKPDGRPEQCITAPALSDSILRKRPSREMGVGFS